MTTNRKTIAGAIGATVIAVGAISTYMMSGTEELLITEAQKQVLRDCDKAGNPYTSFIREFAAWPDTARPYGDGGQWDLMMYWITGDKKHLQEVINIVLQMPDVPANRNESRDSYGRCLSYSWVKHGMTSEQNALMVSKFHKWAEFMLANTRLDDSDECTGHYFGIRLIDKITGSTYSQNPLVPKMEQQFRVIVERAQGGAVPESSDYDGGTSQIWLYGSHAVGIEEFPYLQDWFVQKAQYMRWELTYDLNDSAQWGDVEHPHTIFAHSKMPLMGSLIGLGYDKDGKLLELFSGLNQRYKLYDWQINLCFPLICGFDPRSLKTDPKPEQPLGLRTTAVGNTIYQAPNTMVQVFTANRTRLDHEIGEHSVRWYRNGEWVLDHPIGYSAVWNANTSYAFGLAMMPDRGLIAATQNPTGFSVLSGCKGPPYEQPYWDPPPAFIEKWDHDVSYDGIKLTIRDDWKGTEPTRKERYNWGMGWNTWNELNDKSPWQHTFHSKVEPTPIANGFTYTTAGGQEVTIQSTAKSKSVEQEVNGENLFGTYHPPELGWYRIRFMSSNLPEDSIESVVTLGGVQPPPPVDPEPGTPIIYGGGKYRAYPDRLEVLETIPADK